MIKISHHFRSYYESFFSWLFLIGHKLYFSAIYDLNTFGDLPGFGFAVAFDEVDALDALNDLSKYDMCVVQPGAENCCYVELTPVGVLLTPIRHNHPVTIIVLVVKVLIPECLSIYTLTTCAIPMSDITTLNHKPRDDSVESASFIVQILPTSSFSFFSCTKGPEIL